MRGSLRYLGVMRGKGTLAGDGDAIGDAEYEIDGYVTPQGGTIGSGEVRMGAEDLARAFACRSLTLTTDKGRVLQFRFTGKRTDGTLTVAHAELTGDLPPASAWRR